MCGARVADDNNKKRSQLVSVTASLLIIALCNTAVQLTLAEQQQFQRRNLEWLTAAGGTWSGTLPQKKRSQHITVTAYLLIIALFDPAVSPRLANLKHFQRRNLQWLSATGGTWSGTLPQKRSQHITVTAYLLLSLCLTPPFRHPANNSDNSKGGI